MAKTKEEIRERRKKKYQEKKEKQFFQKILDNEMFTVAEVAHVFNRSTATIRHWEYEGTIPKAKKYINDRECTEEDHFSRRKYTREELYEVICGVLNREWIYDTLNWDFIKKVKELLEAEIEIAKTERSRDTPAYYM